MQTFKDGWHAAIDAWLSGDTWERIVELADNSAAGKGQRAAVERMMGWLQDAERECKLHGTSYEPLAREMDGRIGGYPERF